MKISDLRQSITVSQGRVSRELFSDLRPGDKITAKITGREGSTALLEFRGRSITADFIAGVPPGATVDLVLSEKTPDRIAFTVAGRPTSDEFVKLLQSITILSKNGLEDFPLHNLMKFLGGGKGDLLTLNLFLAGIRRDSKDGRSPAELFSSLISRGIPYSILSDLSSILAGRGGAALLAAFYSTAGGDVKGPRRWKDDNLNERIEDIISALSGDEEALTEVLLLLTAGGGAESEYGEIPFPDGGSFSRLRYIAHDGAFFFDMEFSALGRVSAAVKRDKSGVFISVFSDNDDIIALLKGRREILYSNLEMMNIKKPVIAYYNSKKMIDKLDIWRTDFYIKREFDVRI